MSCKCAVCRASEIVERDPRFRVISLADRMVWMMLVRTFDVHGVGRCRWLQASRDPEKLAQLMVLPAAEVQTAVARFEALGLIRRNGSGDVFVPNVFISMVNLRRKWRRDRQQHSLAVESLS